MRSHHIITSGIAESYQELLQTTNKPVWMYTTNGNDRLILVIVRCYACRWRQFDLSKLHFIPLSWSQKHMGKKTRPDGTRIEKFPIGDVSKSITGLQDGGSRRYRYSFLFVYHCKHCPFLYANLLLHCAWCHDHFA
jgi:hypothetical protein